MGKQSQRYRKMEKIMTYVLIGDGFALFLYLLAAGFGLTWLKALLAVAAIIVSGLGLGYLYMTKELLKVRSRWMSVGFAAVILCLLVSLILNYPSPSPLKEIGGGAGQSSGSSQGANNSQTGSADNTGGSTGDGGALYAPELGDAFSI